MAVDLRQTTRKLPPIGTGKSDFIDVHLQCHKWVQGSHTAEEVPFSILFAAPFIIKLQGKGFGTPGPVGKKENCASHQQMSFWKVMDNVSLITNLFPLCIAYYNTWRQICIWNVTRGQGTSSKASSISVNWLLCLYLTYQLFSSSLCIFYCCCFLFFFPSNSSSYVAFCSTLE